jgi:hypothetical protein
MCLNIIPGALFSIFLKLSIAPRYFHIYFFDGIYFHILIRYKYDEYKQTVLRIFAENN